jgi:hypothetical protein
MHDILIALSFIAMIVVPAVLAMNNITKADAPKGRRRSA